MKSAHYKSILCSRQIMLIILCEKHFLILLLIFKNKQKILREKNKSRGAVIKELVSCLMTDDNRKISSKSEGQV